MVDEKPIWKNLHKKASSIPNPRLIGGLKIKLKIKGVGLKGRIPEKKGELKVFKSKWGPWKQGATFLGKEGLGATLWSLN